MYVNGKSIFIEDNKLYFNGKSVLSFLELEQEAVGTLLNGLLSGKLQKRLIS